MMRIFFILVLICAIIIGINGLIILEKNQKKAATITKSSFGHTAAGEEIYLYSCANNNGLKLKMITFGAIVVSLEVPDRDGNLSNINLGFNSLEKYLNGHPYFGATIGRFCNRIAKGKFTLNDSTYSLKTNDGKNHLHGGEQGYDKVVWEAREYVNEDGANIEFSYKSYDGEEGYPGNVDIKATYSLTNNDELKIAFAATTDKATPINLTNHNYWNLNGAGNGDILEHELIINANHYLEVYDDLIPTGGLNNVEESAFNFRTAHRVGSRFQDIPKIENLPLGYDHCFVIKKDDLNDSLTFAAMVKHVETGRIMEVYTTHPGIQFYTGNFLDGGIGSGGFQQYSGFCLETQHFPDAPNQPKFKSTIVYPGQEYNEMTIFRFLNE
jgi:aldose 1-epimerase|tara:strand:+ start:12199 stop:13347 length:1149 start_codon:yes stop_codon:yes gene_type:complete